MSARERSGCTVPWDMHYSSSATSLTRPSIDSISQESDALYRDLRGFIRPCTACATMIIRGARLIALEQQIKDGRYPAISADQLFADPLSASDYAVDRRFTGKTAPIYVSAIQCASLVEGKREYCPYREAGYTWSVTFGPRSLRGVFSPVTTRWNTSSGALSCFIPELGRVDRRHYDTDTQLWAHPFRAEWAAAVDQLAASSFYRGRTFDSDRTYTVNGLIADRSLRHLAPDCFSHTGFTAEDVVRNRP
ncbi:hypothetical protein C8J57DRAFT_1547265 [Mycena rebaudengoi]|nr:hypothetical protein C8J57DRAFT_1547265 [Mycena rebaudengoi]